MAACRGFGKKTEQHILDVGCADRRGARIQLALAMPYADALVAYLRQSPGVGRVMVAGSYRRGRDTIGDLDILVTARAGRAMTDRFVRYPTCWRCWRRATRKPASAFGVGCRWIYAWCRKRVMARRCCISPGARLITWCSGSWLNNAGLS